MLPSARKQNKNLSKQECVQHGKVSEHSNQNRNLLSAEKLTLCAHQASLSQFVVCCLHYNFSNFWQGIALSVADVLQILLPEHSNIGALKFQANDSGHQKYILGERFIQNTKLLNRAISITLTPFIIDGAQTDL